MEGWHFLSKDRRLQFPPHTLVEPGQTLRVDPPVGLCKRGLHASRRAIDALRYAPGPIVCRVRLGGEIIEDEDKAVATERTVLWMADATQVLHEFAFWCAEQALLHEREMGREPDPRSWAAIEVKRRWLRGEATDEQLDAARAAAWAAAGATWDAWDEVKRRWLRGEATDEQLDAARAAAWAAAGATWDAWDAARAARAVAWTATRAAVWATWSVARDAGIDAAGEAAWDAANEKLEQMLMALEPAGGTG